MYDDLKDYGVFVIYDVNKYENGDGVAEIVGISETLVVNIDKG